MSRHLEVATTCASKIDVRAVKFCTACVRSWSRPVQAFFFPRSFMRSHYKARRFSSASKAAYGQAILLPSCAFCGRAGQPS